MPRNRTIPEQIDELLEEALTNSENQYLAIREYNKQHKDLDDKLQFAMGYIRIMQDPNYDKPSEKFF